MILHVYKYYYKTKKTEYSEIEVEEKQKTYCLNVEGYAKLGLYKQRLSKDIINKVLDDGIGYLTVLLFKKDDDTAKDLFIKHYTKKAVAKMESLNEVLSNINTLTQIPECPMQILMGNDAEKWEQYKKLGSPEELEKVLANNKVFQERCHRGIIMDCAHCTMDNCKKRKPD